MNNSERGNSNALAYAYTITSHTSTVATYPLESVAVTKVAAVFVCVFIFDGTRLIRSSVWLLTTFS
jgi:hypothetical protein